MFRRLVSLPVFLAFIFALAGSQAVVADGARGNTLVGAWLVEVDTFPLGTAESVDVTVVHKDGTVSNSDGILGTGHGIWKRLGAKQETEEGKEIRPSTFQMKFKTPFLEGNSFGIPAGFILTVTATVTLDRSGNTAAGPFETTIGPPGFPSPGFAGEVRFARITFDN